MLSVNKYVYIYIYSKYKFYSSGNAKRQEMGENDSKLHSALMKDIEANQTIKSCTM